MSQNPLENIKKRQAVERRVFPNPAYEALALKPLRDNLDAHLIQHTVTVQRARVVDLFEVRTIKRAEAAESLRALENPELDDLPGSLPLDALDRLLSGVANGQSLLASAPEEVLATAGRLALRETLLAYLDGALALRDALGKLALGHLTTAVTVTANGQMVQPTTLAHYLTAFLGPLQRTADRAQSIWERLNRSPLGAAAGVSTAITTRRDRQADLLAFEGPIENTLDALASLDVEFELISIVAGLSREAARLVTGLGDWARDDFGTIVPSEEFVHMGGAQPQRRDPLVLEVLGVRLADEQSAIASLPVHTLQRSTIPSRVAYGMMLARLISIMESATETLSLLAGVLTTLEVNRALTANRTHRGFATSSELADLLAVDGQLGRTDAYRLAERIAAEASIMALGGMTMDTKLVDKLALEVVGREIGIEPETLGKALAVKRFIERREVPGGPAPSSVREMLEREHFHRREDRAWLDERREALGAADARLREAVESIVS